MKNNKILYLILVVVIVIVGFFWWNQSPTEPTPTTDETDNQDGGTITYQTGEMIEFTVNNTVEWCGFELPFSIIHNSQKVIVRHGCEGIIGHGLDQYCENGQIRTENVYELCIFSSEWCGNCSDIVYCRDESINETFTWNQQEYKTITEQCEERTISRQVKQQVEPGQYKIVVNDEIIKEFVIE